MDPDRLVDHLEQLGLTRNQSLAYLTLLEDDGGQGLTGYEVGSRSGVPRSAVYKVLRQLEEVGAAFSVGQEPQRFFAAAPDRWLDRVRRTTASRLDAVGAALSSLPQRTRPEPVWIVRRYDEVLERIGDMIRSASRSVYVSMWRREIERLRPVFEVVATRPLHRVLHCPESLDGPPPGFSAWIDPAPDDAKAGWSHKVLVVVDRREALIGGSEPGADNHAVWTTNPSLVDVATNHIILDLTLMSQRSGRSCEQDVAPMMRPHLVNPAPADDRH
ncbi:MAG: helix-turn-helix domain-containing protein [Myxococcota bacterium]